MFAAIDPWILAFSFVTVAVTIPRHHRTLVLALLKTVASQR